MSPILAWAFLVTAVTLTALTIFKSWIDNHNESLFNRLFSCFADVLNEWAKMGLFVLGISVVILILKTAIQNL